jgi:hypothetical protein
MFTLKRLTFVGVAVLAISFMMTGCASAPKLGDPTPLQQTLNTLPTVPLLGKSLKFEFGGNIWIAKVDGKEFLAGTFASEDAADGSVILKLKQTHLYSAEQKPGIGGDIGWLPTPGPEIALRYKEGETLTAGLGGAAEALAPAAEALAPAAAEAAAEALAPAAEEAPAPAAEEAAPAAE